MSVKRLMCPGCSAPLTPPEGRTQFFCQFCGATVVVPQEPAPLVDASDDTLHLLPSLDRITIEREGDRLTLSWQWRTWLAFFLIPFALFWNGIVLFIAIGILATGMSFILLFLSLFIGVGAFLIYYAIALLVNGTTVDVENEMITVTHGPLPWKTPSPIPVDDIEQLYVKEKVHRGKDSTSVQYSLDVISKSGRTVTLISGEYDADIPRTIERLLETHLGIADRRVKGEYTG
ncbi:MAG: hypothetical protein KDA93_03720 [Planctomycetaceae bacterium]|nr:hypothetical protein [Planctomycetaceae bacterium]